jgi:hypothetical protein
VAMSVMSMGVGGAFSNTGLLTLTSQPYWCSVCMVSICLNWSFHILVKFLIFRSTMTVTACQNFYIGAPASVNVNVRVLRLVYRLCKIIMRFQQQHNSSSTPRCVII